MKKSSKIWRNVDRLVSPQRKKVLYAPSSSSSYVDIHKHLTHYSSLKEGEKLSLLTSQTISTEKIFNAMLTMEGSLTLAMAMRGDVMKAMERKSVVNKPEASSPQSTSPSSVTNTLPYLKELDSELKRWLTVAFSPDMVELRRISYKHSSGEVLEKIARGESVHAIRSLSELKSRLDVGGKKACFALFSRSPVLAQEPLYFIHVAFTSELSASVKGIDAALDPLAPTHAIFYSVNSLHASLGGLDLAQRLIKLVSAEICRMHPSIKTLSTLSPMPGFREWLFSSIRKSPDRSSIPWPKEHYDTIQQLAASSSSSSSSSTGSGSGRGFESSPEMWLMSTLTVPNPNTVETTAAAAAPPSAPYWTNDKQLCTALEKPLLWAASRYIAKEKLSSKKGISFTYPLDPVARFHIRNGASFHRVNWLGNPSQKGLSQSCGMMVNYLYDLKHISVRAQAFEDSAGMNFHVGDKVNTILKE